MYVQYNTCPLNKQASEEQAGQLAQQVEQFVHPLLVCLDLVLDRRLVRTFVQTMIAIIVHRSRSTGLWLSELGGALLSPDHAPAGTRAVEQAPGWDAVHQRTIQLKVLALVVQHPDPALASEQFWLVVCRRDHNLPPWYLPDL